MYAPTPRRSGPPFDAVASHPDRASPRWWKSPRRMLALGIAALSSHSGETGLALASLSGDDDAVEPTSYPSHSQQACGTILETAGLTRGRMPPTLQADRHRRSPLVVLTVAAAGGWVPSTVVTAVLAGLAATAGLGAIVMNWVMQRDQQVWQEGQEAARQDWELQQERQHREWQEAQRINTRWDEFKRGMYAEFIAAADQVYNISDDLADVRRSLAEDLANHMAMVEDYYEEREAEKLRGMSDGELKAFWEKEYEEQLEWVKERRKILSERLDIAKARLGKCIVELELVAPAQVLCLVRELSSLSEQTYFGTSRREKSRKQVRARYTEAVRNDLRVPS
jgi:hypothetical protein